MWGEVIIGLLGLLTTGLTWYFKRKQVDPYKQQVKNQHENYQVLLAKYAALVKERNTLREALKDLEKQLYEGYDINDLISVANRLPKLNDEESN